MTNKTTEPNTVEVNNTANVSVGKGKHGGYVFVAPAGTTLPTDATTALDEAYKNLGFLSEDGVKEETEIDSEDFKDLNGDIIQTSITSNKKSWTFAMTEVKEQVFKELFGAANVTVDSTTGKIDIADKAIDFSNRVLVMEILLTNGKCMRKVAPLAKIQELSEVSYVSSELIKFEAKWLLSKDTNDTREYIHIGTPAA